MNKILSVLAVTIGALAAAMVHGSITLPVGTPPDQPAACANMVYAGSYPVTSEPVKVLCKSRYVIGYSVTRHAPLWVAETITKANVRSANIKRVDNFRPDPALPASDQSTLAEFVKSGWDRGHQVPFEDLADSATAADESFYMTNMVAQAPENNREIWRSLEEKVRKLAMEKGIVYVVTGPIFDASPKKLKGGTQIPSKLYKVVIVPSTHEAYTFIIPNVNGLNSASLPSYLSNLGALGEQNPAVKVIPAAVQFKTAVTLPH